MEKLHFMNPFINQLLSEHSLGCITIGTLEEKESLSLLESLKSIPPLLDNERLASKVVELNPFLEKEKVVDLLELLFSLYDLYERSTLSANEISAQVAQSIREDLKLSSSLSVEQVDTTEQRLILLLNDIGTIANSYKALNILKDHKSVFTDCRVFTDMRPIFGEDVTEIPVGIGIMHTLKLVYFGLDGSSEFFIGLDFLDLQQLAEEIQRAISKEKTIRSMLDDVNIHCL
jgi:hypothetical protein